MAVTHIVWFRHDLRMTDNRALYAACQDPQAKVITVYIATPDQWQVHDMAPRQAAFIYQNLQCLVKALSGKNIPLFYHQSSDFTTGAKWLADFCRKNGATDLFYNRQYELNEQRRDDLVAELLTGVCEIHSFDDALLLPPGSVVTGNGEMYKVFTPFRKAFLQRLMHSDVRSLPAPATRNQTVELIDIRPFDYPQQLPDPMLFPAGERAALQRLRVFCREQVSEYSRLRDIPSVDGTSVLSPYLVVGVLSPRQCLNRLLAEHPGALEERESGAFFWLNELIWREFYRHLLIAYPRLCCHKSFVGWTDNVRWNGDIEHFSAWQRGETGYPIVDAAMRQLNQTGWMHNRLRMIVASFLVKDLLINWRAGERYFMSQLLDGDLAANNGGWQWAASSGTDAAPYFRIFNPTTQGERFDKKGDFIRRWIPELADVPDSAIHHPHQWAVKQHYELNYPQPLVDHALARKQALQAFEDAKRYVG